MTRDVVKEQTTRHLTPDELGRITAIDVRRIVGQMCVDGTLTRRQYDVWMLRAGGATWDHIALALHCQARTARIHFTRANHKILATMKETHLG